MLAFGSQTAVLFLSPLVMRTAHRLWLAGMAHNIHLRESEPPKRVGLDEWMARVAELADKARRGWHSDDIHDLRTAIRRCRAMAEALSEVNPDPGWRKLKKSTRKLFRALGDLRDTQIKVEWLKKLGPASDTLRKHVGPALEQRIFIQRKSCDEALAKFDPKDWRKLSKKLSEKAQFFPSESVVYQRLALARLNEAVALQEFARKGRSRVAWHRLRIGLKHFRYTLENFTPQRGEPWLDSLKRMQDLLGEVHDLDVLRREIWRHKTKLDPALIGRWLENMEHRRKRRLDEFSALIGGNPPMWQTWRAGFRSVPTLQLIPPAPAYPVHSAS
jgi:CHAD domain-containing protein